MKKRILVVLFIMATQLVIAQYNKSQIYIIEPDSNKLVIFSTPFVNIQFHDITVRESFNLNATIIAIKSITELFIQNNFNLTEDIDTIFDPVNIISNSSIARDLIIKGEQSPILKAKLSSFADDYKERYICFIFQNGFYSSDELEYIIMESNSITELKLSYYKGIHVYETFLSSATQIDLIVWDNLTNEILIHETDLRYYEKNKEIFQKKSIEKQIKNLIKKYNKSIVKKI